jgi:hypothetical protein
MTSDAGFVDLTSDAGVVGMTSDAGFVGLTSDAGVVGVTSDAGVVVLGFMSINVDDVVFEPVLISDKIKFVICVR